MVSGLAPGITVVTVMVGKSTSGRGDTGSMKYASPPVSATASVRSVVATGRVRKGAEMFRRVKGEW